MSLDLFCSYLTLSNDYYNTFILNNFGYGFVVHEDGHDGVGRWGVRNIGCRNYFV